MERSYYFICIAILLVAAGCKKASDPPPAPRPDAEAMAAALDAADEERAARAHLTATMTDEQILRAIGVNPAAVRLKPFPDGYGNLAFARTAYTNETTDIEIDRSPGIGELLVYGTQGRWLVKGRKP